VDQVYHGDSRMMREVPDGVVSLVVCSPPYNVRKPYGNHDDDMLLPQYKALLMEVWAECKRVLRPGGRLCVNVAGVWRQPYLPLHAVIWHQLVEELGFLMRGEIIWDKGASVGVSTAWGSFASPSNPTLRDVHEQVIVASKPEDDGSAPTCVPRGQHHVVGVYSKDSLRLENSTGRDPDIENGEFVEWTRSVWHIATESATRVGHPAPFPVELPTRLIRLYTYPGDLVLDPFAGSGSTCVAARLADRHYIGYDIDADYVATARSRLSQLSEQIAIPGLEGRRAKRPRRTVLHRMRTTAFVAPTDIRNREVQISVQGAEVQIGVKTLGEPARPDTQKQNVNAGLSPEDARRLAQALQAAADLAEAVSEETESRAAG
jgi:site-specific DNA-methyltransferase (adenine-specific)